MSTKNNLNETKCKIIFTDFYGQTFSMRWENGDADCTIGQLTKLLLENVVIDEWSNGVKFMIGDKEKKN